jgi:beta-fructofuranosidase
MTQTECLLTLMGYTTYTTNVSMLRIEKPTCGALHSQTCVDNPTAEVAGNQHWGHATSNDLFTWINQPIALYPDSPGDGIFSGSAVVDVNNTSGFFPNQTNGVVAIYTLNTRERQTQDIAYSHDNGYSFIKYKNNPVIGSDSKQFRDPKVIYYAPTERWIMVVAYSIDFEIGIFSSPNLMDWTPESNFSHHGLLGLQYECPNLIEIPLNDLKGQSKTAWLMMISINPGAPLGGSITQYFPGSFNGTHFEATDSATRLTDFAKDDYAAQFFYGIPRPNKPVSIGWASNWQYANVVPTALEGFRSVMTVAHEHYLTELPRGGLSLITYPHNISAAIESELASNSSLGNGTLSVDYSDIESGALYWEANMTGLTDSKSLFGSLNFTFLSSVTGESVSGGTILSSGDGWGELWLDRGNSSSWSNSFFTDKFSVTGWYDRLGSWRISGIIDRSIIEVFLNAGQSKATSVFYSTEPLDKMIVSVGGVNESTTTSIRVWSLKAFWLGQADQHGTVVGNITQG